MAVHLGRRELLAGGVVVPMGARAFEIVEVLVRSANELVSKNDLMDRIWPGAMVGENTLQVHISAIRKAFGPDRSMLKTASGRGYRLLGNWMPRQPASVPVPLASPAMRQPGAPPASNFPVLVGRLLGRAAAARHVRDLVSAYRVVTLTGPGGIGKTVLAQWAAHELLPEFDGGGWLVEFASLANPDLMPSAVAAVLGLKLGGEEISGETLARAIGGQHTLLMLDNCEHVIDAAANLAETLIRLCPHVTILLPAANRCRSMANMSIASHHSKYRLPTRKIRITSWATARSSFSSTGRMRETQTSRPALEIFRWSRRSAGISTASPWPSNSRLPVRR
jgi:DNA-binding winged helix-turn-helix (wHTH) protein